MSGAVTYQWQEESGTSTAHLDQSSDHWGTCTQRTEDNKNEIKKQKIINENSVKIEKLKLSQKTKSEEESRKIEQQIAKLEEQTKLKIAKMKDDTVRFKFENEPVTITKKAGEQYVLSPKLG